MHANVHTVMLFEEVSKGVPPADWDSSGVPFLCVDPNFAAAKRATEENLNYRQRALATREKVLGLKHSDAPSLGAYWHGQLESANGQIGEQATPHFIANLLRNAWGGLRASHASQVDNWTSPVLAVTDTHETNYEPGDWLFILDRATARGEFVQVEDVDGFDIPLRWAPQTLTPGIGTHGVGAVLANYLHTPALTNRLHAQHITHSMLRWGDLSDDVDEVSGIKLNLTAIAGLESGGMPLLQFQGVSMTHERGISAPTGPHDPAGDSPLVVGESDDHIVLVGNVDAAPTNTRIYGVQFGPGLGHQRVPGLGGGSIEGTLGHHVQNVDDMTVTVTFEYSEQWKLDFLAQQHKHLLIQIGTAPGRAVALYFPNLEIAEDPDRGISADETAIAVQFRALERTDETEATGDQLELVRSKAVILHSVAFIAEDP